MQTASVAYPVEECRQGSQLSRSLAVCVCRNGAQSAVAGHEERSLGRHLFGRPGPAVDVRRPAGGRGRDLPERRRCCAGVLVTRMLIVVRSAWHKCLHWFAFGSRHSVSQMLRCRDACGFGMQRQWS